MTATPVNSALDGERAALLKTLGTARQFLKFTAQNLTDEQAAATPTVSELSIGGLIKHVTDTERVWVEFIVKGTRAFPSFDEMDFAERANTFRLQPGETLAGVIAEYDRVAEETERIVTGLESLDVVHPLPEAPWFHDRERSAREVIAHLIHETAQHAGHADIIRETIDGQKSMG